MIYRLFWNNPTPGPASRHTTSMRPLNIDHAITSFDTALRTLTGVARERRPSPAKNVSSGALSIEAKRESGRLMRINHCGEVCAQALYLGQGLTSGEIGTREAIRQAAEEETDHLAWCAERLRELDTKPSYLNPAFFAMSFLGGAITGLISDRVNLGFVAATEELVVKHLDLHLEKLPEQDTASRAILAQMSEDEAGHQTSALDRGGLDFPSPVKQLMKLASQVMTRSTYWF